MGNYKNIFTSKKTEEIFVWDDKDGMLTYPLSEYKYAYKKDPDGEYTSIFGDKLKRVYNYNPNEEGLFESDINITNRVLIDLYGNNDDISSVSTIAIDIEVSSDNEFPSVETANKEITAISVYDFISQRYYCFILDKENIINKEIKNNIYLIPCKFEDELLTRFFNLYEELMPDIITSWNGNKFDMPYLYRRCNNVMGRKFINKLSPVNICYENPYEKCVIIAGVSQLDYMDLYRKFIGKLKSSYSLNNVCKEELGTGKIQFDGSLDNLYKNDINKFIEYNLNDVELIVKLDNKFKYLDLGRSIAHIGHITYGEIFYTTRYIEGAILTYLWKNGGYISPNKSKEGKEEYEKMLKEGEEGFEGAFVKQPIPQLYEWISSMDINSLYPSLIRTLNISPETKYGKILNWNEVNTLKD